jgi:SAM-dependent methyltransferase
MTEPYDGAYFDGQVGGALRSARHVVRAVLALVQPASVLDVGCGRGAWLKAFHEAGVADVRGADGDYQERAKLLIDPERFTPLDLRHPERLTGRFDLVTCLEVAEHLPPDVAPALVAALTERAPVVLFSAAVPGQTGTNHVNEQWPEYWDALFAARQYRALDLLRPRLYGDAEVEWWYRQNLVLYASAEGLARWPALAAAASAPAAPRLEWVHVDILRWTLQRYTGTRFLARELLRALGRSLRRRLTR